MIFAFHLIGLALELFKVRVGSWAYPEDAWAMVAGVPLYSGFMYAAVGSYICQAFRRFDLRVNRFPWLPAAALAVAAYANFFTHHYLPDLRWLVALGFVVVLWRSRVSFTVGARRYAMPLSLSFVLIGFFLWVAENGATWLGAWQYPDQAAFWQLVHVGKWGSWALLVSLSFVLVAAVKRWEGTFYGDVGTIPAVTPARHADLPGRRTTRGVDEADCAGCGTTRSRGRSADQGEGRVQLRPASQVAGDPGAHHHREQPEDPPLRRVRTVPQPP